MTRTLPLPSPALLRFFKFGVVGGLGLVWDITTVYALRPLIGLTAATLCAYFIAASLNWMLNRLWTFRDAGHEDHPVLQWLRFLSANGLGFLLNRGTVYTLFFLEPLCVKYPFIALAVGALAGLVANFNLSRRVVFRERTPETPLELVKVVSAIDSPTAPPQQDA